MHILITGAAGMIGRKLIERLVVDRALNEQPIEKLTLLDVVAPTRPAGFSDHVKVRTGDLADPAIAMKAVSERPDLKAVVLRRIEAHVGADCLQMTVGERSDPDILPGWRNHQFGDTLLHFFVGQDLILTVQVREAFAASPPAQPIDFALYIAQTDQLSAGLGVGVQFLQVVDGLRQDVRPCRVAVETHRVA